MDILVRLRVLLWLLVLGLWGVMTYQFLEDERISLPEMHGVAKDWARRARGAAVPRPPAPAVPEKVFPPRPPEEEISPLGPAAGGERAAAGARQDMFHARAPEPSRIVKSLPSRIYSLPPAVPSSKPVSTPRPPKLPAEAPQPPEAPAPEGFTKTKIRHFIVYAEGEEASAQFLETLENLHTNIMLDLAAFSPWARDERVLIFLFRSQDSYRRVTGRPAWSGGASSVRRRKIYLYESDELVGILAHELTHIYFDSFFLGGQNDPLWLSEGMATLVQTERGLSAPNWLKENLSTLRSGGGYNIADLVRVENTSGADDDEVRLWYTQSYSIVRFLIRSQYRSSFFRFCRYLREGSPLPDSLYRAYGMPFNRIKALEYAWRYDLKNRRI